MGWDVVAVVNVGRKYLTFKGLIPLAQIPNDPLKLAVLPMKEWVRESSQMQQMKIN